MYLTAKTTSSRPSELIGIQDSWAALQFDNAVCLVGVTVDNLTQELVNNGSDDKPRWEPKYSLQQLLDPEFRIPSEEVPIDELLEDMRGIVDLRFDEVTV